MYQIPQAVLPLSQKAPSPDWLEGVRRYQRSHYVRPECPHPVVWQHRQARCLYVQSHEHVPTDSSPVVLFIPSLINRYYILDLCARQSLVQYLADQGMHVYLVDWGEPSEVEADCGVETYITNYLVPLLAALRNHHDTPVTLTGYCVGGLLAMALAVLQPDDCAGLALLASPWDFHAEDTAASEWRNMHSLLTDNWCRSAPLMPGEYLSWLFYLADPVRCEEKYSQFAHLEGDSEAYERFVAVEHWVNDSVPLTRRFAHDCLIGWVQHNQPARGQWRVAGQVMQPAQVSCPVLVAAPRRDRIVPPACALSLSGQLQNVEVLTPDTGHIGMIIGRKRHEALWEPLYAWIQRLNA